MRIEREQVEPIAVRECGINALLMKDEADSAR